MTRSFSKSVRMYFFSALASALSSLKQNLEKSYIPDLCKLHAWMKLHVWMKEYFSVIFYLFFFFRFIINCIKALIRITIMEMTTLKLPFSYNGKARRLCRNDGCNVSLWRLLMRRCNDVVFATSSGASIATIWRWWMAKSQQRCNDVILSTGNLQTIHIY